MSARILKMPHTAAGRQLLRESILDRCGVWDFPDGSRADHIDWDALATTIAEMLRDLDDLDREADAYQASRIRR